MWETAIHQVKCTHVKHEKNINESRRENVQNERKIEEKNKGDSNNVATILYSRIYNNHGYMDLYDLDNVQNKVFVGYVGRIYFISFFIIHSTLTCSVYIYIFNKESQQFPAKICRKTYKFRRKAILSFFFFFFCTQVRYIRQKEKFSWFL